MSRQSISFTEPNSDWLRRKIEEEGEYRSNSELVNELIRKERAKEQANLNVIRNALIEGERSGLSDRAPKDIIEAVLARKGGNEHL